MMKTKALLAIAVVGALTAVNSVRMVEAGQQESVPVKPASGLRGAHAGHLQLSPRTSRTEPTVTSATPITFAVRGEANETPATQESAKAETPISQPETSIPNIPRADEAVINMPEVFKHHPKFERLRVEFKKKIEKHDVEAKRLAEAGSPEFETYRKQAQQELMAEESKMYLLVFREIQAEVAEYARENGIRLVRRATTQPINVAKSVKGDLSPKQVVEIMNRPIVFVDNQPRDITRAVIERIKRKEANASTARNRTVVGVPLLSETPVVGPVFRRVTWPVPHTVEAKDSSVVCPQEPSSRP